jgi:hypothetical protein
MRISVAIRVPGPGRGRGLEAGFQDNYFPWL